MFEELVNVLERAGEKLGLYFRHEKFETGAEKLILSDKKTWVDRDSSDDGFLYISIHRGRFDSEVAIIARVTDKERSFHNEVMDVTTVDEARESLAELLQSRLESIEGALEELAGESRVLDLVRNLLKAFG